MDKSILVLTPTQKKLVDRFLKLLKKIEKEDMIVVNAYNAKMDGLAFINTSNVDSISVGSNTKENSLQFFKSLPHTRNIPAMHLNLDYDSQWFGCILKEETEK